MEPSSGYLLCASPRSGSTLLCDLLTQTRVAGAPESYVRPASIPRYASAWNLGLCTGDIDRRYVEAVRRHGDASTGCFGMRIMGSDRDAFLARLAVLHPDASSDRERLQAALGIHHFVWLSRDDKIAQAVSLVIAAQTGVWHRNADGTVRQQSTPAEQVRYDHDLIATELEMLTTEERGWNAWFSAQSITPLQISYESLALDPIEQTRNVLRHIGRSSDAALTTGTVKLATSRNTEWVERFQANEM